MNLGSAFWRLLSASGFSNLADGVAIVALPLLATSITRDPLPIAVLPALTFLPWLLFAVPGGAIVDRVDRRWAMAVANSIRAGTFFALAGLAGSHHLSLALLYVAAFAMGTVEVIYDSAARALLPQVLDRGQLERGNGYLTVTDTVFQQFVGSPVGAMLFATAVAVPFVSAGAAYGLGALLILTLTGSYRPARATTTTFLTDVREGLAWLWRHSFLRGLMLIAGVFGLLQAMVNAVFVLYALEWVHLPVEHVGLLMAAAAVGGVTAGLLASQVARLIGRGRALVASTVVCPLGGIGMGLVHDPWIAAILLAISAFAVTIWNVISIAIRQALVPEGLFGRVQGVYRMVIWGVIPVGALLGGWVARHTSIGTVFILAGSIQLVIAVWVGVLAHRYRQVISEVYTPTSS